MPKIELKNKHTGEIEFTQTGDDSTIETAIKWAFIC